MFFAYPEDATQENWVHECLVAMVKDVHARRAANKAPTKWPNCFPNAYRDKFKPRWSLKKLRNKYATALRKVDIPTRERVLRCMDEQNEISSLLCGASTCERIHDLPQILRPTIESIFEYGFDLIKELGIRDRHYRHIYDKMVFRDCPFCGTEPFDAPNDGQHWPRSDAIRISEDLDHYLPRDYYPFAAANLRNLAPAGRKCNGVKSTQDPIRSANHVACIAFDPYSHDPVDVSLIESAPFSASDGASTAWTVNFVPDFPECATWDRVYNIRDRWIRNDLEPQYKGWLTSFALWAATRLPRDGIEPASLIAGLKRFIEDEKISQRTGRERFRVKVMEMLHHHCLAGNVRLLDFLKDYVEMAISALSPPPSRN